ncbi:elongation factor EF-3 [Zopfochytrium polystomum]|nr:elongation factor EF-3 [Zopfochytrium polystomum]
MYAYAAIAKTMKSDEVPLLLQALPVVLTEQGDKSAVVKQAADAAAQALLNYATRIANESIITAQPYLIKYLPSILSAAGEKKCSKDVKNLASATVKVVSTKITPNAIRDILPALIKGQDGFESKGATRVASLTAIASFGELGPEQLGAALPEIVPEISKSIIDTDPAVSKAAEQALAAACDVIGNRDLEHMTGPILRSITHPEETKEIMHKLAGVTFVQSVESPALAMITPLLIRGLQSGVTATMRQSAVIIDNVSRLVNDPIDAAPFMGLLLPALAKACEVIADPEARGVALKTQAAMEKLNVLVEKEKARQKYVDLDLVIEAIKQKIAVHDGHDMDVWFRHVGQLCCSLMTLRKFDEDSWKEVEKFLLVVDHKATHSIESLRTECEAMVKPLPAENEEDDDEGEELCNCTFTLAYGTKILLHNTHMRLKRGAKYGLLGGNDSGKTTLMRSIANGSVEGFPDASEVRTVFVEADILGELSHLSCVDYILNDPRLAGVKREDILSVLATVGFTETGKAKPNHAVSTLSGGWRMKLALARAMLQRADILLLDEPTNHLDVLNVKWVINYINSLKNVTCIMVSHDRNFLNSCCTNILQIDRLKLNPFKGNLDAFIAKNPDAKAYFSLKESKLTFKFPEPGPIEGIKSRSKALMKMSHCDFTYPGNTTPTLFDISIQVSMASRVGCVGENGAGKSTMIKVLTGEVVPQTGDVWRHPNARVAYVAQHAFHHIENHLDKTPNEYIRWRYADGSDKESLVKVSMILTPEEKKLQGTAQQISWKASDGKLVTAKKQVNQLTGLRRTTKNDFEYEVIFQGESRSVEGIYLDTRTLQKMGWEKEVKAIDTRLAQAAGMYVRTLSSAMVEQHLGDVGLEAEFATHYRMSALSGGQKVKVVMAAALWNQPHILILDEPTNYLDREALGALAKAIEEFGGGVVIISHNSEFVSQICKEEWLMDAGHLTTKGESGWMDRVGDKLEEQEAITVMVDAFGNKEAVKQKKKMSKREEKLYAKKLKEKIDAGLDLDDDEYEFATEHNLF